MKLIHFIIKCSSTNWTTFENAQLLLVQNLRVCKTLIGSRWSKLRWTNNLLGHHQIISLRSIYTFLGLNGADTKLSLWHISNSHLTNLSKTSNIVLTNKRFDITLSVLSIFWWYFGTVTFKTDHSSWNPNYLILICLILLGILLLLILTLIS